MTQTNAPTTPALTEGLLLIAIFLLSVLFYTNAWVVDDAYITYRTSVNFVEGRGLTWNVAERVQSYTNPLWMLVMAALYAVTGEVFYTGLLLSYACVIACLWAVYRYRIVENPAHCLLFAIMMVSSKAVFDYSSSGLETVLTYVLLASFYLPFLCRNQVNVPYSVLVASLSFVNRQDTVLLYVPALLFMLWQTKINRQLIGRMLLASAPAWGWLLFSLFYYGFLFPNTAYAKVFAIEIDTATKLHYGWQYIVAFAQMDWFGAALLIATFAIGLYKRARYGVAACGVGLYMLHILYSGGMATHMIGRLCASPAFLCLLIVLLNVRGKLQYGLCAMLIVYNIVFPYAPAKVGTAYLGPLEQRSSDSLIDTKFFVHRELSALMTISNWQDPPDHAWYREGQEFAKTGQTLHLGGGNNGGPPIGYFAFAAGPQVHVVDFLGLSDAFVARLPVCHGSPGHYWRDLPAGYIESIEQHTNKIEDSSLHEFYGALYQVISGPLFSWDRMKTILAFNLGTYNHLVTEYRERHPCGGVDFH